MSLGVVHERFEHVGRVTVWPFEKGRYRLEEDEKDHATADTHEEAPVT